MTAPTPPKEARILNPRLRWVILGVSALMLLAWLLHTPAGLLGKADAVGYAVCHRISERSFHIDGRPLSLCARCSGMYLGALVGLVYQFMLGRRKAGWPPKPILIILGALILAFAIDGSNSYIQYLLGSGPLYHTDNTIRVVVGTGMGLVLAAALYPAFNQTIWRQYDPGPAIQNWRRFGGLAGLAVLVVLLLLSDNPLILYPLSLISAGSVMLMLTMLYTMITLTLTRNENFANNWQDLLQPLLIGFIIALLQVMLLDYGRLLLVGSWNGFPGSLGN
jgi:uncharacterized membrane protein